MKNLSSILTQDLTLNREFRIIPAGKFRAIDGRPAPDRDWELTEIGAYKIIADVASRTQDSLIDYGHKSIVNGDAIAAGWFRELVWKPDGLYLQNARWTERAKAAIQAGEYRFVSPVIIYDKDTFAVTGLQSLAITNTPALPALTDLSNVALSQTESINMAHGTKKIDPQLMEMMQRMTGMKEEELKANMRKIEMEAQKLNDAPLSQNDVKTLSYIAGKTEAELKASLHPSRYQG
ncbi:MAG: phage protease [Burkholderiaceae bacterium]|nr:phage protease [Burkholderiaceae bacterium]